MPRLSIPLTEDQHAAIRRKAGALGVPQAEVARRLLLAWVRGELEMPTIGDIYRLLAGSPDSPCEFDGLEGIINE
jgi:hypothetical protein